MKIKRAFLICGAALLLVGASVPASNFSAANASRRTHRTHKITKRHKMNFNRGFKSGFSHSNNFKALVKSGFINFQINRKAPYVFSRYAPNDKRALIPTTLNVYHLGWLQGDAIHHKHLNFYTYNQKTHRWYLVNANKKTDPKQVKRARKSVQKNAKRPRNRAEVTISKKLIRKWHNHGTYLNVRKNNAYGHRAGIKGVYKYSYRKLNRNWTGLNNQSGRKNKAVMTKFRPLGNSKIRVAYHHGTQNLYR